MKKKKKKKKKGRKRKKKKKRWREKTIFFFFFFVLNGRQIPFPPPSPSPFANWRHPLAPASSFEALGSAILGTLHGEFNSLGVFFPTTTASSTPLVSYRGKGRPPPKEIPSKIAPWSWQRSIHVFIAFHDPDCTIITRPRGEKWVTQGNSWKGE